MVGSTYLHFECFQSLGMQTVGFFTPFVCHQWRKHLSEEHQIAKQVINRIIQESVLRKGNLLHTYCCSKEHLGSVCWKTNQSWNSVQMKSSIFISIQQPSHMYLPLMKQNKVYMMSVVFTNSHPHFCVSVLHTF